MAKKKGGKKKKKSKEELEAERLAAEEAERLRLEEEERIRQEQEILRKEQEEKERLEREALRKAELERLEEEASQSRTLAERRKRYMDKFLRKRARRNEWAEYLLCNPLPSSQSSSEINTYLKTVGEERFTDVETAMRQCQELQQVIRQFIAETVLDMSDGEAEQVHVHKESMSKVFQSQVKCLDQITAHVLSNTEDFVSPKMEVLLGHETNDLKFGVWINMATKGFRMKIVDFPNLSLITEIPKTLALQNIAVRVIHTKTDSITPYSSSTDSSRFEDYDVALGGVLFVETLKLPPQSKSVKGWMLRPVNESLCQRVQRLNFNSEANAGPTDVAGSAPITVAVKFKVAKDIIVRNIDGEHCHLVPSDDLEEKVSPGLAGTQQDGFQETTVVRAGAWDPVENRWTEDGITDVMFDPVSRVVSFNTSRLTAMALLQSRCADIPFRFWSIKPIFKSITAGNGNPAEFDPDQYMEQQQQQDTPEDEIGVVEGALLLVKTDSFMIKVEIRPEGICKLLEPIEPELESITNVSMPASDLFNRLAECGVNIIAPIIGEEVESMLNGTLCPKASNLEKHIYEEISAAVSSSFAIATSKWNQHVGKEKSCVAICEANNSSDASFDMIAFFKDEMDLVVDDEPLADNNNQDITNEEAGAEAKTETKVGEQQGELKDAETGEEGKEGEEQKTAEAQEGEQQQQEDAAATEGGEQKTSEEETKTAEAPKSARSSKPGTPKSKKRKGKKSKKEEEAQEKAPDEDNLENEEENKVEDVEEEPVPTVPRTILFEVDPEATDTGIKCTFIRAKDHDADFDDRVSQQQVSHIYLENALLESGIYTEAKIHKMQDNPESTSLRRSIFAVLQVLRPLSFTK